MRLDPDGRSNTGEWTARALHPQAGTAATAAGARRTRGRLGPSLYLSKSAQRPFRGGDSSGCRDANRGKETRERVS